MSTLFERRQLDMLAEHVGVPGYHAYSILHVMIGHSFGQKIV